MNMVLPLEARQISAPPYLTYPEHPITPFQPPPFKRPIYVQGTDDSFNTVVRYFLKHIESSDWTIVFPNEDELQIWLKSMRSKSQPASLLLNLTNTKLNINLNLTIGEVFNASLGKSKTIITIYITNRPFGQ